MGGGRIIVELSLDFDYENLNKFEPTLDYLHSKYGDAVRVRKSSCRGWHIWVKGVEVSPDEELKLRKKLGDCDGRMDGDYARLGSGLKTSRLFTVKGRLCGERKVVKQAGSWLSYEEYKERYKGGTSETHGRSEKQKEEKS